MLKTGNILAIDDSTTNNVLLEAVLETSGYSILISYNANEAWSNIRKNSIDLILLDLLMPDINGFDFLKQIKQHAFYKSIPIIVISAANEQENIDKCIELGAVKFISKPIDINILLENIDKAIQSNA